MLYYSIQNLYTILGSLCLCGLYHTILYHTIIYYTILGSLCLCGLYHTIPYHTIPYHTIPYHTIPYHTIPYHTIPYHTILYYTILYYTILYYDIPYWDPYVPVVFGVVRTVGPGCPPVEAQAAGTDHWLWPRRRLSRAVQGLPCVLPGSPRLPLKGSFIRDIDI